MIPAASSSFPELFQPLVHSLAAIKARTEMVVRISPICKKAFTLPTGIPSSVCSSSQPYFLCSLNQPN